MKTEPYRYCIYCGISQEEHSCRKLGDEHIIPFSLGGTKILSQASCEQCERTINKEVENIILSEQWGLYRAKHRLPTRNPKKRRTTASIKTIDQSSASVPLNNYPTPIPIYDYGTAGLIGGRPLAADFVSGTSMNIKIHSDTEVEKLLPEIHPNWDKTYSFVARPDTFARFIAKVAHCALFWYRAESFCYPTLPDVILGKNNECLRFIGGEMDNYQNSATRENPWNIHFRPGNEAELWPLVVDLDFFGAASFPKYHALAGWIDPANDTHMLNFQLLSAEGRFREVKNKS